MAEKWSSKIMFPRDNYVLRCTDESFGPSKSSGNPMITLEFEVVSPETVQVAGQEVLVAGVQLKHYLTTQSMNGDGQIDTEKSKSAADRLKVVYSRFGLPSDSINPENPTLGFKGKLVHALLRADITEQRKTPTPEQIAKGEKQGDVIVNPVTGKPRIQYYPKIEEIDGLAQADPNKPY